MAVMVMRDKEVSRLIFELSRIIDFKKDLPNNVFLHDDFMFWFFERPFFVFSELFSGLIFLSFRLYKGSVFIKFCGDALLPDSCIALDGDNVEGDTSWVSKGFDDFFGGKVGYPVVLFNEGKDWILYESAYEEFGVLAVKRRSLNIEISQYLDCNFISPEGLAELASGSFSDSVTADAFMRAYCL